MRSYQRSCGLRQKLWPPTAPAMAPKVARKRKREQQCEAEQVHWWTGKDLQLGLLVEIFPFVWGIFYYILLAGHLAMITQTDQCWILPYSSSPSPVKFFSAEATNKFSVACLKQRLMATWRLCFQRCVYIWMSPCRFHINVFQECKGLVGYNVGTPFANEDNQVAETPLSCHHCWGKVWTLASRRS